MQSVNWELTPYEQCRKPHETLPGNTEIAVSPSNLQNELQCPICLDILTNTMTTKECLHRFCSECITTALRNGNKECPTCRKKLVSHRSLRKDTTFDAIVAKIFPDRSFFEEKVNKRIAKLMEMNVNARLGKTSAQTGDDSNTVSNSLPPVIELLLKLNDEKSVIEADDLNFFNTKYFSTSPNASIDHLMEFLKIRYAAFKNEEKLKQSSELTDESVLSTDCNYELQIFLPSNDTPLDGHITLADIVTQTLSKEPFELVCVAKYKR